LGTIKQPSSFKTFTIIFYIEILLRTKHQYSIEKPQEKYSNALKKEIISDNKPLQGGNLLLPHLNVQVQDDSK
jgi:hypothetical protein